MRKLYFFRSIYRVVLIYVCASISFVTSSRQMPIVDKVNNDFFFGLNATYGPTPTYCIDENVLKIFKERIESCLSTGLMQELYDLKRKSTSDFQRAHEILAHDYFMDPKNPHRKPCDIADFEYIPLLPVSWKAGIPTRTLCTAGGYCPRDDNINPACSYTVLINNIMSFVNYVKTVRKKEMGEGTIALTLNPIEYKSIILPHYQ